MKKIIKVIRAIGYLIAFSLILYPVVSNYINQMHSTTIATDYEQEVSHLSEEQENEMIEKAQEYNKSLVGINSIVDPFSENGEPQTEDDVYNNLLKIDDTGMMGYIDIPKIDIVLPIYHEHLKKCCNPVLDILRIHLFQLEERAAMRFYPDTEDWQMQRYSQI